MMKRLLVNVSNFIRMILLWCTLILGAAASDAEEILLMRAELSNTHNGYKGANAIDGDRTTAASATPVDPVWLRVYFSSSTVKKVVVEKGYSQSAACVYTVSVYDGEKDTACGTYTNKLPG